MKVRKKPVVVEAWQYGGVDSLQVAPAWVMWDTYMIGQNTLAVSTLEGDMVCNPGDYLILGVANEVYPVREDIFLATYEVVGD